MGQTAVDNTDGTAEGVGEVLYLIMETGFENDLDLCIHGNARAATRRPLETKGTRTRSP